MTKALIIEDDPVTARELEDRLAQLGYAVTESVSSTEAAFQSMERESPDFILLDGELQGEREGMEVAEALRARFDIPVIFLMAEAGRLAPHRAGTASPFVFVKKPYLPEDLRAAIDLALRQHDTESRLQYFERIALSIPGIVYVVHLKEGKYTFLNQTAALGALGYAPDHAGANNLDMQGLIHPDDLSALASAFQNVSAGQEWGAVELEFRMKHAAGDWRWMHSRHVPFQFDVNGRREQFLGVAQDITEQKQALAALRKSETQFRRVVENINDALIIVDVAGRPVFVNDQFLELYGVKEEEIPSLRLEDFVAPEYRRELRDRHDRIMQGEEPPRSFFDYEGVRRDGKRLWLEVSPVLVYEENGDLVGTQFAIRDITERKRMEEGIRRLNRELEERVKDRTRELERLNTELEIRILERTRDLQSANVLLAALEKAAIVVNQSLNLDDVLDQLLEQARKIIPCRGINLMLIDGDHAYISRRIGYEGFAQLERNLVEFRYPLSWPTFDYMMKTGRSLLLSSTEGHPQWHDSSTTEWVRSFVGLPLLVENSVVGFLNASHDEPGFFDQQHVTVLEALATHASLAIQKARLIEELRVTLEKEQTMRAQLVQADKLVALGKMVAVIAHEINNPIQTIKNTFFLLEGQVQQNQNAMEYLHIAKSEANRIAELVEQLREAYRPKSQSFTRVDLGQLFAEVKIVLDPQLKKKQVNWVEKNLFQPCIVFGNPNSLKQVFINICLNATEAMESRGGGDLSIEFQMGPDKQRVGVELKNTGPQIPAEISSHIFEPFITTKDIGTGLGLSITYEIVRQHHGEIALKNNSDGDVSFMVWLPLYPEQQRQGTHG